MSVEHELYSNFPHLLLEDKLAGSILTQTIKVSLHTSSYSYNQDADDYWDDADNEVAATGNYTHEGATLTSPACTVSGRVTTFDAANTTWTSSTITARYAVVYFASGTDSTALLISCINFGADKTTDNGTFELQWHGSGLFTITVAT